MGNHFHLLVKMIPEHRFTDDVIQQRFEAFYGESRIFSKGQIPYFRQKLSSLSEFMREIKVGFARYYNRRHDRRGYFWGDRFKSVIVDKGETLVNCLAYIDLNPLRAGIVDRPEDYRWNSPGYHIQTENKDQFLSTDFGLKEFNPPAADKCPKSEKERIRRYRRYVYEAGSLNQLEKGKVKVIADKALEKERSRGLSSEKNENRNKSRDGEWSWAERVLISDKYLHL